MPTLKTPQPTSRGKPGHGLWPNPPLTIALWRNLTRNRNGSKCRPGLISWDKNANRLLPPHLCVYLAHRAVFTRKYLSVLPALQAMCWSCRGKGRFCFLVCLPFLPWLWRWGCLLSLLLLLWHCVCPLSHAGARVWGLTPGRRSVRDKEGGANRGDGFDWIYGHEGEHTLSNLMSVD